MKIALKVDVDTCRGTRQGVPRLIRILRARNAGATFLFSLGPDHTGRAITRMFRAGFLGKVRRTSVLRHYGIKTLLCGTLLPAPDIGRECADVMREARDNGFEVGIHAWDHVLWQDKVAMADEQWTLKQMELSRHRFEEIFGEPARIHGAAGWQMNPHAFVLTQRLGFKFSSDTRGSGPFIPIHQGAIVACPQLPTTLPTLDEMIGLDGVDARNVRNIVLMRPINSMIEFKQIIGRGTRLYDGKDYFTIYDFVKAHHHFSDPEWDGEPIEPEPCKTCQQHPCICIKEPPPPCYVCGQLPCECDREPCPKCGLPSRTNLRSDRCRCRNRHARFAPMTVTG